MKKIVVVIFTLLIAGCATVFKGTQQEVTIRTNPEDAKIYVDGRFLGSGTATFLAKKTNGDYNIPEITVEAKGYRTQTFRLQKSFDKTSLVNLIFLYSWTTDFLTGAMFEYAPNSYMVQLLEKEEVSFTDEQKLQQFVLKNSENLMRDFARGEGEYLEALKVLKPNVSFKDLGQDVILSLENSDNPWNFYLAISSVKTGA